MTIYSTTFSSPLSGSDALNYDFENYFKTALPGSTTPIEYGSVSMGNSGVATYTDPTGKTITFDKSTPTQYLYAANPYLATSWENTYGQNPFDLIGYNSGKYTTLPASTTTTTGSTDSGGIGTTQNTSTQIADTTPSNTFELDPTKYPITFSQNQNQSTASSNSGINWDSPVASALLPNLINAGKNMQSYADNLATSLNEGYGNMMRQAMRPGAFTDTINQLSGRGVLNSDIAKDAIADVSRGIIRDIANKAFESQVAQAETQLMVPSILKDLISLGQESSSQSQSTGDGFSLSKDESELYRIMADLLAL